MNQKLFLGPLALKMDRENSNKYPVFELVSPQVEKMEEEKKEIIKELEITLRNKHDINQIIYMKNTYVNKIMVYRY